MLLIENKEDLNTEPKDLNKLFGRRNKCLEEEEQKKEIFPDPKFGDVIISKFMNNLMIDGKKSVAEKIVYGALDKIENKLKTDPVKVFMMQ